MKQNTFHPTVIRGENSFCVYLPEWNVSGEGRTLQEAWAQYEERIQEAQERAGKFGLATSSPESWPTIRNFSVLRDLSLFFTKIATAAFAVVLVGILLLPHITAALKSQINPLPEGTFKRLAIETPAKLNEKFDRLSPEEQQQLIHQWGKLWKRTAPFREIFNGDKSR